MEGKVNDLGTWSEEVFFEKTGSVFFQIIFAEESDDEIIISSNLKILFNLEFGKPEWINIEPALVYKGKEISYQQICMQTLVSKCIGNFSRWKDILKIEADLGYNAFHFTPIQELGYSGSNYCIKDQIKLNENLFGVK